MKMPKSEKLLREYVREILSEDFGGGDFGGGMGFGGGYIEPSDMYKVFIKPFTDVVQTTVGKTKEMAVATSELLRVATEAVLTSIIPALSSDYDDIFRKYEGQLQKVKSEYQDIYDSTWTAFKDNDVLLAAFGMYPSALLTQLFVRKAPIPIIHTLDALTGGFFEDHFNKVLKILNPNDVTPLGGHGGGGGGGGSGGMDTMGAWGMEGGGGLGEGVLREKKSAKKDNKSKVINMILNPKILDSIDKNPRVQEMMKTTHSAFRATLEELYDNAQEVMSITDLQQLQQVSNKQIQGLDKILKLPENERNKASQQLLSTVKTAIKNLYIKNLVHELKAAQAAGVPKGHPMLDDFISTIKKIKAL